jgi:chromosome segregation ATPase
MALSRILKRDFNNDRGLDPRAVATLNAKKNSRSQRENDLRRKQVEREINSLRARLAVVNRELQRLAVSERRYHGDEARAEQEFERESRSFEELTKELGRHSDKVRELQQLLNTKKVMSHKTSISSDFGAEAAQKESDRLKNELKRVDQEIEQLNGKRRRLTLDLSATQQKVQKAHDMELKSHANDHNVDSEIQQLFKEIQSEETILGRFKSRFTSEQKRVSDKQRELDSLKKRMTGSAGGAPALESEKQKIEQKINELEKSLN